MSSKKEKTRVVVRALITGGAASGGPPIGPAVGPTGIKWKLNRFPMQTSRT